ncbi:MAG: Salicylate hydroxylase [Phycisphaerales bacterium]|nr:Salicylate hydroxylase [Phycisphaerales bacterium]
MTSPTANTGAAALRVAVLGGSLGGLAAALALRQAGHDVTVYERSEGTLHSRGAGIVIQGEVLQLLAGQGVDPSGLPGVMSRVRQYLGGDGRPVSEQYMPQSQTSWEAIYLALRGRLPEAQYVPGHKHVGFEQRDSSVTVQFENGRSTDVDFVVAADGHQSLARAQLLPSVAPEYAGYVAWRGVVDEPELSEELVNVFHDRFSFFQMPHSHILAYFIPGEAGAVEKGSRRLNWVWYVNVPAGESLDSLMLDRDGSRRRYAVSPGMLRDDVVQRQKEIAAASLAPPFARLVNATREPFVQGIYDLGVPKMAFGRVALVGDAAFIVRPHTAASTAKAAADAMSLGNALTPRPVNLRPSLVAWERRQMAMGQNLVEIGTSLGNRSQFGRD